MITSYATLQTAIQGFAQNDGANFVAKIPEFIASAEERIYNDLRIRAMEAAFSEAIASGVVAVPSGFIEWKHLYIDGAPVQKLSRESAEWIYTNYPTRSACGKPKYFAREAESIIFAPYPDSTYTVKGVYYKRLTALSDSNTTNWFIVNAPDLLKYASLCESAAFSADERLPLWEQKYQAIAMRLKLTDARESHSGSLLSMTRG
jgi:hypothetical protein